MRGMQLPFAGSAALLALAALLWAVGWGSGVAHATAEGGLRFPAPAGTTWTVLAGYNTYSHYGDDPHALDLTRVDGPTEGSAVLAPLPGSLIYIAPDCVAIADENGMAVLLCHMFPTEGLQEGDPVSQGQQVGTVAPPYYAGNNGTPHLHLAVHQSLGGGYLGLTVPFTGRYALEGHELSDTPEPNAYTGETFTSGNQLGGGDPSFLYPGWNLVGWAGAVEEADAPTVFSATFRTVLGYSAEAQSFLRYSPEVPEALNELDTLSYGDGFWIFVMQPGGVYWPRTIRLEPRLLALERGFNLVSWTGSTRPVADAVAGLEGVLQALYAWDPVGQTFRTYRPGTPDFLNDLTRLRAGDAVWIQVSTATEWVQA